MALCALTFTTVANAQTWRVGQQTVSYSFPPTLGDGSTANGGTPPYFSSGTEPAIVDQVGYTRSAWITGSASTTGGAGEAKLRITCHFSKFGSFDPILAYGVAPPTLHHHTFFGAANVLPNSDYTQLRNSPKSSCTGGPNNSTAYWETSLMQTLTSGARAPFKPDLVTFYYSHLSADGPKKQRLPRGFAFIGGVNPMNFNDTGVRAEVTAAGMEYSGGPLTTVAPGQTPASTYWGTLGNNGTPAGFLGWQCYNPGTGGSMDVDPPHASMTGSGYYRLTYARYLKGPFGEDPWNGRCLAGYKLIGGILAPVCWDGVNPKSPDGRGHVRYDHRKPDDSYGDVCPQGWYKVPHFEAKTEYSHKGWTADLQYRYLSSDRMRVATTECPDAAAPCDGSSGGNDPGTVNGVYYTRISNDPCRARTLDFCNGATLHFDWLGAWDQEVMNTWMAKCLNMTVPGKTAVQEECNDSTISYVDNQKLLSGTPPDAALSVYSPVVNSALIIDQNSNTKYGPIETGQTGPFTGHGHKP